MPYVLWVDPLGNPAVGFQLFFYLSEGGGTGGTDVPATTYADPNLSVPNPQPVVALANGQWPPIFLNPAFAYKCVLEDANNNQVWTADPISANLLLYPLAFEFLGGSPPTGGECMGMHTFVIAVSFPAAFAGSMGFTRVPPAAPFTASIINQASTPIGSFSIDITGVFTFTTASGAPQAAAPGDTWIVVAPSTADTQLANLSWTLAGVVSG